MAANSMKDTTAVAAKAAENKALDATCKAEELQLQLSAARVKPVF